MTDRAYNVLFLCSHNSARSVMAECLLNREGKGHFRSFSQAFVSLPIATLDRLALKRKLDDMGQASTTPEAAR